MSGVLFKMLITNQAYLGFLFAGEGYADGDTGLEIAA